MYHLGDKTGWLASYLTNLENVKRQKEGNTVTNRLKYTKKQHPPGKDTNER